MQMQKLWTMAWKEIYVTYKDRNLLLVMIATPLLLSTIIGLAFGGFGSSSGSFSDIPIAIVNQDAGAANLPQSYGTLLSDILLGGTPAATTSSAEATPEASAEATPQAAACASANADDTSLATLFDAALLTDEAAARAGVADGTYTAIILIPAGFSRAVTGAEGGAALEVIGNAGTPITANIVQSVVSSITQSFVNGNAIISATINTLVAQANAEPLFGVAFGALSASGQFQPDFSCAFSDQLNTILVEAGSLQAEGQQQSVLVQILLVTGTAQAVFFAFFTAQFGLLSLYEDKRANTLQRILVSPTPRSYPMLGKILGTYLTVVVQVVLLMLALTAVASIAEGRPLFIWGENLPLLTLYVLLLSLSVSGVGALTVGIARTQQQAQIIGPLVNSFFAILGGAFGFTLPVSIARFSPIYWASDGFNRIALGNDDIALNIAVLLLQGGLMFLLGTYLFNRRITQQ